MTKETQAWIKEAKDGAKIYTDFKNGDLRRLAPYICYDVDYKTDSICLDGDFTIEQLEALLSHMKQYSKVKE